MKCVFTVHEEIKVKLSLSKSWRHIVAVDVYLHSFMTMALDVGQSSTLRRAPLPRERNPVPS